MPRIPENANIERLDDKNVKVITPTESIINIDDLRAQKQSNLDAIQSNENQIDFLKGQNIMLDADIQALEEIINAVNPE
jgi:hypothetical protein